MIIPVLRWFARILGLLLAGFFLFMFIGEWIETRHHYAPMNAVTVIRLSPAFAYVIGMFLALKRERAGAKLGGASLVVLAVMIAAYDPSNKSGAIGTGIAGLVFSFPVILYGLCWWLEERDRKRHRSGCFE